MEAKRLGYGGISKMSIITGLDRKTISRGIKELDKNYLESQESEKRVRKSGGGRKLIEKKILK